MARRVHKPGPAGEKAGVHQQWISMEILRILIERRLAGSRHTSGRRKEESLAGVRAFCDPLKLFANIYVLRLY